MAYLSKKNFFERMEKLTEERADGRTVRFYYAPSFIQGHKKCTTIAYTRTLKSGAVIKRWLSFRGGCLEQVYTLCKRDRKPSDLGCTVCQRIMFFHLILGMI